MPSPAARALVTRRTRTLGLIVTGAPDYGPSSTALHFNEAARDARYSVITASMLETDAPSMRSAAELLVRQNVEAIVLIAAQRAALDALDGVELGVPIVAVASEDRGGMHRVWLDQYAGARLAVDHLIALGHREIRHVAGPTNAMDAAERVRGWSAALGEHGLPAREPLVGDWSPGSGYAHGTRARRRSRDDRDLRLERPDGAGRHARARRGGALGAGRRQRRRVRRHPRGGVLRARR